MQKSCPMYFCIFILFSNQQKYYHILLHRLNILQVCQNIPNTCSGILCMYFTYRTKIIYTRLVYSTLYPFLAPPAERQRSFSNTDLSVVRLSVCLSVRPSVKIEGGGGVYLRNASVTFHLFWHEASFGWHKSHIER